MKRSRERARVEVDRSLQGLGVLAAIRLQRQIIVEILGCQRLGLALALTLALALALPDGWLEFAASFLHLG